MRKCRLITPDHADLDVIKPFLHTDFAAQAEKDGREWFRLAEHLFCLRIYVRDTIASFDIQPRTNSGIGVNPSTVVFFTSNKVVSVK